MKRRGLALLMAAVLGILTGCGSGGGTDGAAAPDAQAGGQGEEQTGTAAAEEEHEQVELSFTYWGGSYEQPLMEKLIADFDLGKYRKYPVSSYSGGVKRRLDIALNMMSNPRILFLDEPTVGMDIQSRMAMWDMMKKIRSDFGTTIFLTTHYLEEADQLSDAICIMKDGKEVIQGSPDTLKSVLRQNVIQVKFATNEDAQKYLPLLQQRQSSQTFSVRNASVLCNSNDDRSDMLDLMTFLLEHHIPLIGVEIVQPTLEDVFIRLTQDGREGCA